MSSTYIAASKAYRYKNIMEWINFCYIQRPFNMQMQVCFLNFVCFSPWLAGRYHNFELTQNRKKNPEKGLTADKRKQRAVTLASTCKIAMPPEGYRIRLSEAYRGRST
jgi:hypothetical protein